MVINVLDLVPHCYSAGDGEVLGLALKEALQSGEKVTVSFSGVEDIPSSFANAAFVSLLSSFSYDHIRNNLSIVNSTRQINGMIKRRFDFESTRRTQAA